MSLEVYIMPKGYGKSTKEVRDYIHQLQQKVEQLENIIKEAIEYIKEDMYEDPNELFGLVDGEHLLNILNK